MMHGFGFPLFMGGPIVWILIIVGGYFLIRKVHAPSRRSSAVEDRSPGFTETEIYRLAKKLNGKVTVSDIVTELGLEPKQAEKILESMTDGMRVRMEVEEDGMVYYLFPELQEEGRGNK